jgi:sugar/nucleoside kinase (ribokinase family)
MTLIDTARAEKLYAAIGPAVEMSGGSAANTVAGVASLGGMAAYLGKVNKDQLGAIFRHDLLAQGVHFALPENAEAIHPTGSCIILVTPDAERSMNTYLRAAVEFSVRDVDAATLQQADVTYLEGYLFDPPKAKEAFYHAAKIVHASGNKLALTLSDSFCVERHRADFRALVQNDIDILFANEHELRALYQTQDLQQAIDMARTQCTIVVTTRSEKGALAAIGNHLVEIAAVPVPKAVDSTGAGDLFAAGFLFGITQGKDLAEAGHIGAIAAAEIIGHYGPRPQVPLKSLL